jgi:hypothetical protein
MANRDFSDLVANADTNLAVAAVGDYLLIYDISEPLDINKIKVITTANLASTLVTPVVSQRQGGSATDWKLEGTTNYTPSSSKIQVGVTTINFADGQASAGATITFPAAFAHKPMIFLSVSGRVGESVPINSTTFAYQSNVSVTGCTIYAGRTSTSGTNTVAVNWMAIGD